MAQLILEVEGRQGEAAAKALEAAITKLGYKVKSLDDAVKKNDDTLKRNAATIAKSTADYGRHVSQQERLVAALQKGTAAYDRERLAVAQENKIAEVSAQLRGKNAQLTNSQAAALSKLVEREHAATAATEKHNRSIQQFEQSVSKLRGALGLLLPGLSAFGAIQFARGSLAAFTEFETGLIGVAKTANLSDAEMAKLGKRIDILSTTELPVATKELLDIGQAAGSLGITGVQNLEKYTTTIAKLGRTSDLSGGDAAATLARLQTVTGESADTVDRLASVITRLGNDTNATEAAIARTAGEVARASAIFGVSSAEAAAFGATLESFGIQAEIGRTAIADAFRGIQSAIYGGGQSLKLLEKLTGQSGAQLKQTFERDAVEALTMFLEGIAKVKAEDLPGVLDRFKLSGDRNALVLPVLAQRVDNLRTNLKSAADEWERNTALQDEFARGAKSVESQLQLIANAWASVQRAFGEGMAVGFIEEFRGLQRSLNEDELKTAAREIGKTLGEALGAAAKAAKFLADNVDEVRSVFVAYLALRIPLNMVGLARNLAEAAKAGKLLQTSILGINAAMLASPLAIVIAALAILAGGIYLYTKRTNEAHAAMLLEIEQLDRTRIATDLLAGATKRLTEEQHRNILAHMQSTAALKLDAEAKLREMEAKKVVPGIVNTLVDWTDKGVTKDELDEQRVLVRSLGQQYEGLLNTWKAYLHGAFLVDEENKELGKNLGLTLGKLSEDQEKALKAAHDAMAEIALEADLREREARAAVLGADALREMRTAGEAEGKIRDIRLKLQAVGLDLSEQEISSIARNIARRDEAAQAIDREKESYQALVDLMKSSISAGVGLQLNVGETRDLKEYAASVADLGSSLARLELTLALLDEAQSAAGLDPEKMREMAQLRNSLVTVNDLYTRSLAHLGTVMTANAVKIKAGESAFEAEIDAINKRTAATRESGAALSDLTTEEQIHKQAMDSVFKTIVGDGAAAMEARTRALLKMKDALRDLSDAEFAAGFKQEVRETLGIPDYARIKAETERINELLARGFLTAAEAAVLFQNRILEMHPRFAEMADGFASVFADAFHEIIMTGEIDFEKFGESIKSVFADTLSDILQEWLAKWFRAMAEWLIRWIATQRAAQVASAQTGAVSAASGGGGGAFGALAGGAGSGSLSGTVSGGGMSGLFGGTGAYGATGAGLAWMGVFAAAVAVLLNQQKTSGRAEVDTGISFGGVGGIDMDYDLSRFNRQGGPGRFTAQLKATQGIIDSVVAFLEGLGAQIDRFSEKTASLQISREGQGKRTQWIVRYADGMIKNFGRDMEAAFEFATIQAIKATPTIGLDPIVLRAIQQSTAETMDDFQNEIAKAQELALLGLDQVQIDLRSAFQQLNLRIADAISMLGKSPELDQAISNIIGSFLNSLISQRDAITGKQLSPQEELERQKQRATLFNAELQLMTARLTAEKANLIAQRDMTRSEIDLWRAENEGRLIQLKVKGTILQGESEIFNQFAQNMGATIIASLAALDLQIEAIQKVLDALAAIKPIDLGEITIPRGGGGRGAKGEVKDFIADRRRALLPDLQQQLADLNETYDGQLKKVKGNADLIKQLNELRAREIALLAQQVKRDLITPYLGDPMSAKRSPFAQQESDIVKQYADLRKIAKDLGIPLWQVNQAERERIRLLQLEAAASAGSRLAQTQLELENLGKTINYLRLRAVENADALRAIGDEQFLSLGDSLMGFLDKYYKGAAGFEDFRLKLEQVRFELEFANMQLQFEMLKKMGIFTEEQIAFIGGAIDWIRGNKPDLDAIANPPQSAAGFSQAVDSTVSDLERLREEFIKAKDDIRSFLEGIARGEVGGVAPDQAIAAAQGQFGDLIARARGGSLEAFQQAAPAARDLIESLKKYSPALFAVELPRIQEALRGLLNVDTIRQGNLVVSDKFAQQQRHNETVGTLNNGFGNLVSYADRQARTQDRMSEQLEALVTEQRMTNGRLMRIETQRSGGKNVGTVISA